MAKDKTKQRPELAAKREAIRKQLQQEAKKRRRRTAVRVLVTVVILALIATGITAVVLHVKAGERALQTTVKGSTQITPDNATSDGLAIVANPGVTLVSGAPTVDIYVDYQDGTSVSTMQYYGQALISLAQQGKISLRFHLYVIYDTTYANTASTRASEAASCADQVGQFMAYNQAVFDAASLAPTSGQVGFTDQQLQQTFTATAGISGADLTTFQTCYKQRQTSDFVQQMSSKNQTTAVAGSTTYGAGVTATPVVLANAQVVDVQTDLENATTSQADADALLTLLTNAAAGSGS